MRQHNFRLCIKDTEKWHGVYQVVHRRIQPLNVHLIHLWCKGEEKRYGVYITHLISPKAQGAFKGLMCNTKVKQCGPLVREAATTPFRFCVAQQESVTELHL